MQELYEFRISADYYHLLERPNLAKFNGFNYVIKLSKDDPFFQRIGELEQEVEKKHGKYFFSYWNVELKYSSREITAAKCFRLRFKRTFEPAGEECGTVYDETNVCGVCGTNRIQVGALNLKSGSVPKVDVARSIAGEVVVSEGFRTAYLRRGLRGALFEPVVFFGKPSAHHFYQIQASSDISLTDSTIVGVSPFDYSTSCENEIYKCPYGHTLGLNLLSEAFVKSGLEIGQFDFFASKQKIGVFRGLLRPEPLYFCSPAFREMVEEECLRGFEFEVANLE